LYLGSMRSYARATHTSMMKLFLESYVEEAMHRALITVGEPDYSEWVLHGIVGGSCSGEVQYVFAGCSLAAVRL